MDSKTKSLDYTEAEIKLRLEEFYATGYSIKEYCFVNGDIEELLLESWLQYYPLEKLRDGEEQVDEFIIVNPVSERKRSVGKRQPQQQTSAPVLFARVGDIEVFQMAPASYLKSLKS